MLRRNTDINRRCRQLADGERGGGPVIYLMSRDQRTEDNWALLWAQQEAETRGKPLMVVYGYEPDNLGTDMRHAGFMLNGLTHIHDQLARKNIGYWLLQGNSATMLPPFLREHDAHVLVTDFSPLRNSQSLKRMLQQEISIPLYEVDAHNIIPAWLASEKKEYAAYTIRPKIHRLLPDYLTEIPTLPAHPFKMATPVPLDRLDQVCDRVDQRSLISWLEPGEHAARNAMQEAIEQRLANYSSDRNNPCLNGQSNLSPYLHFGHLSAHRLAIEVQVSELPFEAKATYLEELIVRRELAENFCFYEKDYDRFSGFPEWAQKTLNEHRGDDRQFCYTLTDLENGRTHEPLWNSCQRDLVQNGKLHGYLRMYWAKKILEWTADPEEALEYTITLNDRYSLDGHDPNGYTGIAWSIGGVHDRAWFERPIFGKVRYMNERGCRRKFSVEGYIDSVENR